MAYWTPQPGPQAFAAVCPADETLFGGSRGGGKLSPLWEKVCTPKGWVEIGNISPGDIVSDPTTGGHTEVIAVYPQGEKDIYRVTCDDGAVAHVGLEHLWAYKLPCHNRPRKKYSSERTYATNELCASVPDERWNNIKIGTTQDLINALKRGFNPRIPLTEPVIYTVNGRTGKGVAPYLCGLLLGDGHINSLTITSCDDEIRNYLAEHGFKPDKELHTDGKPRSWRITGQKRIALKQWVLNHGLNNKHSWDKFIPSYVFTASLKYRLEFLRGLMDTDGTVDKRGRCYYCTVSKSLADGVSAIVRGLGGKAYLREKHPTYTNKGQKLKGRLAYDIHIQIRKTSSLFNLKRKKDRCTDSWNGGHEMMQEIVSIERIGKEEAVCIKVNSPYGLYITNDFIVTHNSDCLWGRQVAGAEQWGKNWNGIIVRRKYKEFAELRRRIDYMIGEGLPAQRIGGDQQTNYVRFKNGAQVIMPAISTLAMVNDHVGQQYCVAEGTRILMADGSPKNIENVEVGDMVATLEGPRAVLRKATPYKTSCVKLTSPFGEQVHPKTHPILSAYGWQSYASLQETYSKEFEDLHQEFSPPQHVNVIARLLIPFHGQGVLRLCLPNESHKPYISSMQDQEKHQELLLRKPLDQQQQCEPVPPLRDCESLISICDDRSCVFAGSQISGDFQSGYLSCHRSHGESSPAHSKTSPDDFPLPAGAEEPFRKHCIQDDPGNTQICIHPCERQYEHPYSGMERLATEDSFFFPCSMSSCDDKIVHDLTVDGVNHYISYDTRIVNKNTEISIDEGTTFPFFSQMVEKLKGSNRSPYGVPCRMFVTGNPGGAGHSHVKEHFKLGKMYGIKPGTVITDADGQTKVFIPSFLDDNRILCENDPKYVNKLRSISDPALRKAWLEGDWDVYIGQAFMLSDAHVIDPLPIPDHAWIYMTFDWGYGKPFSIGWWWVDGEGRIYRFNEWYGCTGIPDEGLRITDNAIAKGIEDREKEMGIWNHPHMIRLAGPDCWNKKPDYKGGGQGPSTAETFTEHKIYLSKGDPARIQKIQQFRERLEIPRNEAGEQIDRPMMQVYNTCKHFLRTIPAISMDPLTMEDVDTDQEDHQYDEACHICMARPLALKLPPTLKSSAQAHIDMITKPIPRDPYHMAMHEVVVQAEMDAQREIDAQIYTTERLQGGTYSDVDGQ